jgi:hypothetical protein
MDVLNRVEGLVALWAVGVQIPPPARHLAATTQTSAPDSTSRLG